MADPKLEILSSDDRYAHISVEPLEKGSGITLGNALRRVLLSSLPGAAITWMKIEGLQHEFTTIPYTKEDATEFLLNVKAIRLRPLSQRAGRLVLEVGGKRDVTAGDIAPSADFEIVNPELHLITLDSKEASLSVEFNVDIGKGFVPAGSSRGLPIGVIPVDAIFTPVQRVNHLVEPVMMGQEGTLERLTLEVWTDGTITGVEAISHSAEMLTRQLAIFRELARTTKMEAKKASLRLAISSEQYDMPIEQLGLSTRTQNCLRRGGIGTVGELLESSDDGLPSLPNFGQKSKDEVLKALEGLGVSIPSQKTAGASKSVRGEGGKMEMETEVGSDEA
jgi:DNA-directed RNA polymerase subunit alpha